MDSNSNHSLVVNEFKKALSQMITEIEVVFDYVSVDKIKQSNKIIKQMDDTTVFNDQVLKIVDALKPHAPSLIHIQMSTKKLRTQDFAFLNSLVILDIDFSVFANEGKNTKRDLVKYLYTIYMSGAFIKYSNNASSPLSDEFNNFVQEIQARISSQQTVSSTDRGVSSRRSKSNPMESLFNNLVKNKDIMNMATEISNDLQKEKIDPMSIMSSLMSGKPDQNLNRIMGNISSKLESKIQSGEINQQELEKQAVDIMNVVQTSDLSNLMKDTDISKLMKDTDISELMKDADISKLMKDADISKVIKDLNK